MRILILGHYEIASNYAISMVVNALSQHEITIALSGKGDAFEAEGNKFSQLAQYEQHLCDELNAGRDILNLKCDGFDLLADKICSPAQIIEKPNSLNGLMNIRQINPDLIISIRYRKILKEQVIEIPKYGVINLHSGLLPEYRGAMATFWAMLNGDDTIGSTLHYISDGTIDTGRIIARSSQKCQYAKSYLQNVLDLYLKGSQELVQAVKQIQKSGIAQARDQKGVGNYYSFPQTDDLSRFESSAYQLY